jgi:stress response protein SCP2
MEIQGKITHVLDTRTGSGQKGDWTVYSYVLETSGQYPKQIAFEVFNTNHGLQVGDTITAQVNLESREYNGKWYTSVKAYKVETQGKQAPAPRPAMEDSESDGLPF